jgi:lupus La protein
MPFLHWASLNITNVTKVEFYFSVHNLSTDRHLFLEIEGANNRPVPVKHITSFKRMRRFQPYSAVVAALRDSESLILLDEGEYSGAGKEAIQRKEPLPVPTREGDEEKKPSLEELYDRMFRASQNKLDASVYVKGFGNLEEAGQIALEDFFKPYGAVMVRRRRDEDDNWKGSVFVEFDTEDSQQQFLALDPKPKFNGNELTIMGKKEYSEMKCKEKGIVPAWRQEPGAGEGNRSNWRDNRGGRGRGAGRGRGRGGDRGGRGRDRRDGDRRRDRSGSPDNKDWNGRRDKFQKSRDYNGRDKRDNKKTEDKDDSAKSVIRDADGVPIIQDTSKEPTKATTKRKAEDDDSAEKPKKSKIEFREDA